MSHEVMAPADWYPDPEHPGRLRYWDGSAWTTHTAPMPQAAAAAPSQQQAYPQQAQPQFQQLVQPRDPREPRAWTRGTLITLIVCIALVLGGAAGAIALRHGAATAHERQAAEALDGFLENATAGDRKWREFANQKMLDAVTVGSPIRGDSTTAEALDLSVQYEVGPLEFRSDLPSLPPDLARARLKLSYDYTVRGEEVASTAWQEVWLSRPFYYGDDVPARATGETPSAVGPWRVTSLTLPRSDDGTVGQASDYFATDLEVPNIEEADGNTCFDAAYLLEDVATAARTTAEIRSYCFLNDGEIELGEDVDLDDLAMSFPAVDALNPSYLPPELVQLDPGFVNNSVPPLREYLIRGANGNYVLTTALVETVGGDDEFTASNRIVSIQRIEEDAS